MNPTALSLLAALAGAAFAVQLPVGRTLLRWARRGDRTSGPGAVPGSSARRSVVAAAGAAFGLAVGGLLAGCLVAVAAVLAGVVADRWAARMSRAGATASAAVMAGAAASALAAGLRPIDALELASRHRSDPLSVLVRAECSGVEAGVPVPEALARIRLAFPVASVGALCTALETASLRGNDATDAVAAVARSARSSESLRRRERAARAGPLIQLTVALGLVPAALMVVASAALAGAVA